MNSLSGQPDHALILDGRKVQTGLAEKHAIFAKVATLATLARQVLRNQKTVLTTLHV